MKKRNLLNLIPVISMASLPIITTISCGSSNEDAKEIILHASLPSTWPQHKPLNDLVKIYNDSHKLEEGFLPVKFKDRAQSGTTGYTDDANKIVQQLQSGRTANVPNLFFSGISAMSKLNQFNKSLDFTSTAITNDKLFEDFTKHTSSQKGVAGIYSIPTFFLSEAAVSVNKVTTSHLIDKLEENGATNSLSTDVAAKIETTKAISAVTRLVGEANYKDWDPKSPTASNFNITDDIFTSYDGWLKFGEEVNDKLSIPNVLAVDYYEELFKTILFANGDYDIDSYPLYQMENDKVIYPFLKEDSSERQALKDSFDYLNRFIKSGSLRLTDKNLEWSGWELGKSNIAMGLSASVAASNSFENGFGPVSEFYENHNISYDDQTWFNQPSKLKSSDQGDVQMNSGLTSLFGIKKSAAEDVATKMFVDWLYTGESSDGVKAVDYLSNNSGYFIPMKDNIVNTDYVTNLNTKIAEFENTYETKKGTEATKPEALEAARQAGIRIALKSVAESLFKENVTQYSFPFSSGTDNLEGIVAKSLYQAYKDFTAEDSISWDSNKFIKNIEDQKSEYENR